MSRGSTDLAQVRSFPQLVKYLRDALDWPIESDDFEDLTFDYTPEELGIDSKIAAKIQEIKRLRPLSVNQPWGVFFVKFEPKRLPVVALRRILNSVVMKKRASANRSERAAWDAEDLLFISNYGEGDARQIMFAHFSHDLEKEDLPTLKVLGWDNLDTLLHIDDVAETLNENLVWPEDEADVDGWRIKWGSAFSVRHREVITTSRDLSIRLAALARSIRDRIRTALAIETEAGPLTKLMEAFKGSLVHDLDADSFADMYAQTIAYGLLSARISNPSADSTTHIPVQIPVTNPFLKELMESFLYIGGQGGKAGGPGIDFDELGVSEVVELLDDANMEAVVRDFGDKNPQEDPVVPFYELFLKEYDAKKRMQRGVFYTPRPVVTYIVRSVHELLQTELGVADGLADTATWGEMAKSHPGLTLPEGVKETDRFVTILDPATGTGTFLVEAIEVIYRTLIEGWKHEGRSEEERLDLWNAYVPEHLLPRMHGFELLMAPYAIAHLKIGLKLRETGYRFGSEERARIYLTNALEPAHDFSGQLEFAIPALAHEAEAVNLVKRNQCFTVVMGNPPYANYSANLSKRARAIVDVYRSFASQPIRERNQLQFERNLQDDFVKFVAIGEDELRASGIGVLGYITNATMLGSMSLRGMREHLVRSFSLLHELHLHGGVNEIGEESLQDQNVFDIAQAVSVHAYVRRPGDGNGAVLYSDAWGPRSKKYLFLVEHSVLNTEWQVVVPDSENCSFLPQGEVASSATMRLNEVFEKFGAGVKTNRDAVAIAFSKDELAEAVKTFSPGLGPRVNESVRPILYRPFDERVIFYDKNVVASRSLPTMEHVLAGPNVSLIASSTWTTAERFSVNVSRVMVEMKTGTHDRGTTLFPLYRYDNTLGQTLKVPNLEPAFLRQWGHVTSSGGNVGGKGTEAASPEDILNWIYGICYSPEYRQRFRSQLAQGFALVLFPRHEEVLRGVALLGGELIALHLMESPALDHPVTTYAGPSNPVVKRPTWSDDTVWLDAAATKKGRAANPGSIGFRGVSEDVWNFHIGGYKVCEKWLKDRKDRTLSKDDIAHYQRIVVALEATIRLMKEIDEVIEQHGGWPGAFARRESASVSPVPMAEA